MDDLISRQAAIDAMKGFLRYDEAVFQEAAEAVIRKIPSAQPKRTNKRTETHECDCISRAMAIDAVKHAWAKGLEPSQYIEELPSVQPDIDEWCTDCSEYDHEKHCCPRWNRVIRNALKDAQPERTGHWTGSNYTGEEFGVFICSKCGKASLQSTAYCCNCGCRMTEGEHG